MEVGRPEQEIFDVFTYKIAEKLSLICSPKSLQTSPIPL